MKYTNPITRMDYPDPDVIRVDDTYYMISTTMHFMPGGVILRSYDLVNWEIASYVYDTLDDSEAQKLVGDKNIYGQGMWAASIRYHNGRFYVCFSANDTRRTYLYQADQIEGPWRKQYIDGFYHDCSLLFDDGRVFIVYGNGDIHLSELTQDLRSKKKDGLDRVIIKDVGNPYLGYEGAHIYKVKGRYYLFLIHSAREEWRRIQACFWSDSLEGEFIGADILDDDLNYHNQGVAQGGIVETPDGKWYGVLFQDRGAVGRIPVLVPTIYKDKTFIMGKLGKVPHSLEVSSTRPDYKYQALYSDDDFNYKADEEGRVKLKKVWQWNHNPDNSLWSVTENPGNLRIKSGKISVNITQAVNTLTQRMIYPECQAFVTVDGSGLNDGDYAGISAFQGNYGLIALTKEEGKYYIVNLARNTDEDSSQRSKNDISPAKEYAKIPWNSNKVVLKVRADFTNLVDKAAFYYSSDREALEWQKLGQEHKLYFNLDHFCGCRFGLFLFSTKEKGGYVDFGKFTYLASRN